MRSKILVAVGVVAAIVGFGVGIGYWAGSGSGAFVPPPQSSAPPPGDDQHSDSGTADQPGLAQHRHPTNQVVDSQSVTTILQSNDMALASTNSLTTTNWEDKVDEIVGSDDPDTNKVKQLFALFPTLPPDGQEEVAQHLSNLVEDDNYKPLGDMLKNDSLPQGVLDELMSDALNRPNSLKLPTLLDVAQDANNPEHDEAKDLLELYLGEDPSTNNWSGAGPMVTNWLQQNPD